MQLYCNLRHIPPACILHTSPVQGPKCPGTEMFRTEVAANHFKAYFQLPKMLGRPQSTIISATGRGHCGQLYTRSSNGPAENFLLVDKICKFLRIVYSLPTFPLGCIKTPRGDALKFVPSFSAFTVDETLFIC